jgi:hypothetical protein
MALLPLSHPNPGANTAAFLWESASKPNPFRIQPASRPAAIASNSL